MDPDKTPKTSPEKEAPAPTSLGEKPEDVTKSNAPTVPDPPDEPPTADDYIQLGDTIRFNNGAWQGREGLVFYRSLNRILILPGGGSNQLYSVPMVRVERDEKGKIVERYTVEDNEAVDEDAEYMIGDVEDKLNIKDIDVAKHPMNEAVWNPDTKSLDFFNVPFVVLKNLKPGQVVTTYNKNSGNTVNIGAVYKVESVDEYEDTAVLSLVENPGDKMTIEFNYTGIPTNLPFEYFDNQFPLEEAPSVKPTAETTTGEAPEEEVGFDDEEVEFFDETEYKDDVITVEAPLAKNLTYKDKDQRNDMFNDLMRDPKMSEKERLQPKRIKKNYILMEQLFALRNDLVNYLPGDIVGGKKLTSYATVSDILKDVKIPLARPIVDAKRTLYYDHTAKYFQEKKMGTLGSVDTTISTSPNIDLRFLDESVVGSIKYLKDNMTTTLQTEESTESYTVPKFYSEFDTYFNSFVPHLSLNGEANTRVISDNDVFRGDIPTTKKEEATIDGLKNVGPISILDSSTVQKIHTSRLRAITSRSGRIKKDEPIIVETSDMLNVIYYLFFPFLYLREFGSTRSGDLALDIAQAMMEEKTMNMILDMNGPIREKEEGQQEQTFNPDKILPVKTEGSILSNLSVADWLSGQPIFGRGLGDLLPLMSSLGLRNKDFNVEQMKVLLEKIKKYREALIVFLNEERTKAEEAAQKTSLEINNLLKPDAIESMYRLLWSEGSKTILAEAMSEFNNRFPTYKASDIARIAFLYTKYPDLLQSTLAGKPMLESVRARRQLILTKKLNELKAEKLKESAGVTPRPNKCVHVQQYNIIQKVKDIQQRMELLEKFIDNYSNNQTKDHWLGCKVCKQHLMCEHEYLMIREFRDPLKSKQYHKELLLTFNDGVFMGQYICKNCGQSIQEIDFDNHMEYNDKGVPMVGRETLEDEDQKIKDELERVLDTKPGEVVEEIKFTDELERSIYTTVKRICSVIGVTLTKDTYMELVPHIKSSIKSNAKGKDEYEAINKKKTEDAKKTGKAYKAIPYLTYYAQLLLGICASALLVEIQTHVPEYVIEYSLEGATPSFDGYPLNPNNQDQAGINYISFGIASIQPTPKSMLEATGFYQTTDDKERFTKIGKTFYNVLAVYLANNSYVQQKLEDKRKYLTEKFGRAPGGAFLPEIIPDGFAPALLKAPKEDVSKTPIKEAAARGSNRISGWMLSAHDLARKGGKILKTAKVEVHTCCYSPIQQPLQYWSGKLPDVGSKEAPLGNRGSFLRLPMILRTEKELFAKINPTLMKKLYARICFDGPRVGYPHEPGYDMKCPYCNFEFLYDARDPLFPLITQEILDKKPKYSTMIEMGLEAAQEERDSKNEASLAKLGVTVTEKSFQELLDTVHEHYLVPPVVVPRPTMIENRPAAENPDMPRTTIKLLEYLRDLENPPFRNQLAPGRYEYREILQQTIANLVPLMERGQANEGEYIRSYDPVLEKEASLKAKLQETLGPRYYPIFQRMFSGINAGDSPAKLAQTLHSVFLLPFQRATTKLKKEILLSIPKSLKLQGKIVEDIEKGLDSHIVEGEFNEAYNSYRRLKDAVTSLSTIIPILQNKLRVTTLVGGMAAYENIVSFLVLGIFNDLLDPSVEPTGYETKAPLEEKKDMESLKTFMKKIFDNMAQENLDFTDKKIREIIEQRSEEDRQNILGRFKKLPDSLRSLESQKKKLGIGEWSVGGKKSIYTYDEDQYARESLQREQAKKKDDDINDEEMQGEDEAPPEDEVDEADAGYDMMDTEDHEDVADAGENAGGVSC